MSSLVLTEKVGACFVITLNRPDALNSFTVDMHRQLFDALVVAASDEAVRSIVLTGAGRGFCAGQDLAERDPRKLIPPLHGALLKNEQDVMLFEKLAFMARRAPTDGNSNTP